MFLRLLAGVVRDFHPKTLPPMLRANYARELVSWFFLPLMLGAVEGGVLGIVVKKMFTGVPGISPAELDIAVAAVTAAPNVANLTSFAWAGMAHGRPKVPFIAGLQIASALLIAGIAAVPISAPGLWLVVILAFLARSTWTGVITVRTSVWRNNYPDANRAIVAGRMTSVQAVVLALSGLVIGQALDASPTAFRWLFPMLALAGFLGNSIYRRVRLRGQRRLQRMELDGRRGLRVADPRALWALLREDRLYRDFMLWMFIFGLGNLMMTPVQTIILNDEFHCSYLEGIMITTILPVAIMPLMIPLWAKLLSRTHIVEFRAIHGWTFVAGSLCLWGSSAFHSMPLMYASSVAFGVGFAGGSLAWNLGHHDFAPAHRDSDYMAVHVTLNGLRGLMAPFLAVALYVPMQRMGIGPWFFGLCFVLNTIGVMGFVWMRPSVRRLETAGNVV